MYPQFENREGAGQELAWHHKLYHQGRPIHDIRGKTVIIIDDGLAAGATMRAAIELLRQMKARRIVVAVPVPVPVGAKEICRALADVADQVACLAHARAILRRWPVVSKFFTNQR